jgi:hypothetical protein
VLPVRFPDRQEHAVHRTVRTLTLAAVTCAVLAVPAVAGAQPTSTPTAPPLAGVEERLDVACARVPNLQRRVDDLLERLPAGADTPGSIAWVQARADRARDNGREELAAALDDRATVLTERLDVLPARQARLAELEAACAGRASA